MKNVLAVHDVSCVGRCSLTVALPIISAMGVTCTGLPTALLSTHTGGFEGFTCLDLTDEMRKIMASWQKHSLKFDGIYSGFLGSADQIEIVKELITQYRTDGCVSIIDPVMADYGKLYSIFDDAFVKKMRGLVKFADVLIPNITEACFLTGIEYQDGPYSEDYILTIIYKLKKLGAKQVVLTGVYFKDGELGVAVSKRGGAGYYFRDRINGNYHGTGDVFGSVLTAKLVSGKKLEASAKAAVDFVVDAIVATPADADRRFGVDFETTLATLKPTKKRN